MFKRFLRKIIIGATMAPCITLGQRDDYFPAVFSDDHIRLEKIKNTLPVIQNLYKEYSKKNHFPGYAFGIMVDGHLIYSGSGGYTNINKKIAVTSQSMFRIASMTKSFTAMAILKLRDEGKLRVDDPVYLYIHELKNQRLTQDAPDITIRDLLMQSSGLPEDNPWGDRNLDKTNKELIALLKRGISFSNVPNIKFEYSNLAYAILGLIINKVSGVSYQKFISDNIWKPLGMKQATWEFSKISPIQLALGYKWEDDHWIEEKLLHDGSFASMGGMITSIESFSRYVALYQMAWPPRNDVEAFSIKRSSIREMQQPWRFSDTDSQYVNAYGYGLRWSRNQKDQVYVGHSGGLPGFGSNWLIMPDYGIGVILFANVTYANAREINLNILNILINNGQLKPRQLPASHILKDRQKALLELLPDWKNAKTSGLFSENFFLDFSLDTLKEKTKRLFEKAGKIQHIRPLIAQNQLRGYFILDGEKTSIKITFHLTPENPSLIQWYEIEEIS